MTYKRLTARNNFWSEAGADTFVWGDIAISIAYEQRGFGMYRSTYYYGDMSNQKKKEKPNDTAYLPIGLALGIAVGAGLGLVLFDNLAIGVGTGLALGVAIGAGLDADAQSKTPKKK